MTHSSRGVLYGARAIGDHLGLMPRQVYSMADGGRLPVFRAGAVLCATPAVLDEWLTKREADARRSVVKA